MYHQQIHLKFDREAEQRQMIQQQHQKTHSISLGCYREIGKTTEPNLHMYIFCLALVGKSAVRMAMGIQALNMRKAIGS